MFVENNRKEIDRIDDEILQLIIQRNLLSDDIIRCKLDNGLDVLDKEREYLLINSLIDKFKDKINQDEIKKVYSSILYYSKLKYYQEIEKTNQETIEKSKLPFIIAGPCSVESEEQIFSIAKDLSQLNIKYLRGGAFKPRTSPNDFQGLGSIGVQYLRDAAKYYNMNMVTEVMSSQQLLQHYNDIDIIQIGSKNMFSYQLLKDIAEINQKNKKPIILKRNFNATIKEFIYAAEYILKEGQEVLLCLRGIRTFEQIDSNLRFTPDLASIRELKNITKLKVIFDPSHSTGNADYVEDISKAALQLGADGLMIETHFNPQESIVDAKQTINYETLNHIITFLDEIKYAQ